MFAINQIVNWLFLEIELSKNLESILTIDFYNYLKGIIRI